MLDESSPARRADAPFVTPARVGQARSGVAHTTQDMLAFDLARARAWDAVHGRFDTDGLRAALATAETIVVRSRATSRSVYLRRPDLGRVLDEESAGRLAYSPCDILIVLADGLSSIAVAHALPLVAALPELLADFSIGPIVIAEQARVALGDDIGRRIGAKVVVMLIGERPGLTTSDSLSIYMTLLPATPISDADRNCISNIHAAGLSTEAAAAKLHWLVVEACRRGSSGVDLKEAQTDNTVEKRQSNNEPFISRWRDLLPELST